MQQTARGTQNVKPIVQGEVVDSDDTYHGDIYGKGAFFMHTLRFVLGDSIFFPALKKLATDPRYTYDNFITTDDVEKLFSAEGHTNLKLLFDFYLRTVQKLDIDVKQLSENKFAIKLLNYEGSLPLEIQVDGKTTRTQLDKNAITITSQTLPVIDPRGYYLKRVIFE
jgi:aminopeptidase N